MFTFSFILPTRKRKELCIQSIQHICNTCETRDCFEILLGFDNDDIDDANAILKYCVENGIHHQYWIAPIRYGYSGLHHYVNHLSKMAHGEFLWLWNDDAVMETKGWDQIMTENISKNQKLLWDFDVEYPFIFPLVPKTFVDILGHFSQNSHNDTWIERIYHRICNLSYVEKRIKITHLRYKYEKDGDTSSYEEANKSMAFTGIDQLSNFYNQLAVVDINRVIKAGIVNGYTIQFTNSVEKQRILFIGMGKLGLPVAVGMANKGHIVAGYDVSSHIRSGVRPHEVLDTIEADSTGKGSIQTMLENTTLRFIDDLQDGIEFAEKIFVAVQTPHDPQYEGTTRIPKDRKDFDYTYLCNAIENISTICDKIKKEITVVIISTVLPGTLTQYIIPKLSKYIRLCYNPYFIAMGTVLHDFYEPEFILLGCNDEHIIDDMKQFYKTISNAPVFDTTMETAELIKVTYNTMISTKIAFINTVMEICDKIPNTNVDDVTKALSLSTRRILSPAYLRGGMGDGGGCHPRDNIAMSWLSEKLDIRFNLFDAIMTAREQQTEYFADLIDKYHKENPTLPIIILGKAFKPDTNLLQGSPSILLSNILKERGIQLQLYDPHIDTPNNIAPVVVIQAIVFIGTQHEIFKSYKFSAGSIVIDPHRYIDDQDDIYIHRVGKHLSS